MGSHLVSGVVDPRFSPVRAAFVDNFASRGELGAGVCVVWRGEVVVDLVGGFVDEGRSTPWASSTLVDVYSAGKGLLALLALQLVDDGILGLDSRIAEVWPEFGVGGKETATVAHLLTHRAGVPAIRELLTDEDLFDWERMTGAIAATEAWWTPGERLAYHTNTFGHLVGELVRRASGQPVGERLRAVADPLGADVRFGVPEDEQHRCADIVWDPGRPLPTAAGLDGFVGMKGDQLMNALAHLNPPGYSSVGLVNTPAWRALPLGSTSGHASASGLARIYAALLEPDRLLSPDLLARAAAPQATGHCPILGEVVTYGLGFQPTTERRRLGPNPRSFGHFGTGGALGFADPDAGIAFGYVMNHLVPRWQSGRNRALVDAVYASLSPA